MLRSLRLLLLTVLVSLSYPLLRCDAQKTAAQYDGCRWMCGSRA